MRPHNLPRWAEPQVQPHPLCVEWDQEALVRTSSLGQQDRGSTGLPKEQALVSKMEQAQCEFWEQMQGPKDTRPAWPLSASEGESRGCWNLESIFADVLRSQMCFFPPTILPTEFLLMILWLIPCRSFWFCPLVSSHSLSGSVPERRLRQHCSPVAKSHCALGHISCSWLRVRAGLEWKLCGPGAWQHCHSAPRLPPFLLRPAGFQQPPRGLQPPYPSAGSWVLEGRVMDLAAVHTVLAYTREIRSWCGQ